MELFRRFLQQHKGAQSGAGHAVSRCLFQFFFFNFANSLACRGGNMQRLIFDDTTEAGKEAYVRDVDPAGSYSFVDLSS